MAKDERESISRARDEMIGGSRWKLNCENCARSTAHELVGWKPPSVPPLFLPDGCSLLIYRCQDCGHVKPAFRIESDSPIITRIGPHDRPKKGGGHEGV